MQARLTDRLQVDVLAVARALRSQRLQLDNLTPLVEQRDRVLLEMGLQPLPNPTGPPSEGRVAFYGGALVLRPASMEALSFRSEFRWERGQSCSFSVAISRGDRDPTRCSQECSAFLGGAGEACLQSAAEAQIRLALTPRPVPTPNTPPVRLAPAAPPSRPEASTSVLDTLERLRTQQQREASRSAPPAYPVGLTVRDLRRLADQFSRCWPTPVPRLPADAMVELRLDIDPGGVTRNAWAARNVPSDPRVRSLFEVARRVVLDDRCSRLDVSVEGISALRTSVLRFNSHGLLR